MVAFQCVLSSTRFSHLPNRRCKRVLALDWKIFVTVFGTVFIAELGDKTQLATLLFASDKDVSKWLVFIGASLALVATSALGVLGGAFIAQHISERVLHLVAGVGFIAIGVWTILR